MDLDILLLIVSDMELECRVQRVLVKQIEGQS